MPTSICGDHIDKDDGGTSPLVSVIVLNWNGEKFIRRSLSSLRKMEYANMEVIVVDNASTDRSVDIIKREFPEFGLLRNSKNLGFSAGMNVGIRASQGDLILLFNNDAIAHPASLSRMVNTIRAREVGIVGGLVLYAEAPDVIGSLGGKFDAVTGVIWAEGNGKKLNTVEGIKKDLIEDLDYVSGCGFLTRRDVIRKIGLFDEQFALLGQDLDWCLKARRAGFRCVLASSAVIWHLGSYSFRRKPLKSYADRLKSDFQAIILHFPTIPMLSALFFQIAIVPFLEVFFYDQSDVAMVSRLRVRMKMFCENLKDLRILICSRKQNRSLGVLRLKPRTLELLKFAVFRAKAKEFYLGKLLQKLE
jgi:GT2 family glycosyltransferase